MDIYDVHTLNPIPTLKSVNLIAGNLYEKTHEALDSHLQIVQGMLTINAISKSMSNLNGWKHENEDLTNTETDSDFTNIFTNIKDAITQFFTIDWGISSYWIIIGVILLTVIMGCVCMGCSPYIGVCQVLKSLTSCCRLLRNFSHSTVRRRERSDSHANRSRPGSIRSDYIRTSGTSLPPPPPNVAENTV